MRVAILSDIHANLTALEAVLAAIGPVDAIWHLGDIVGYGPDPDAVVERLDALGAIGVKGNHDAAAAGGDEADYFNPDARAAIEWTRRTISLATVAWLDALPERRVEGEITLVHGSPLSPTWEYVTSTGAATANLGAFETAWCLHGHTHVPIAWRADGLTTERVNVRSGSTLNLREGRGLANPGSVGQPRDGDSRASWAVLETETGELTWGRTAYELSATQERMRRAGLPPRLVARLDHGL